MSDEGGVVPSDGVRDAPSYEVTPRASKGITTGQKMFKNQRFDYVQDVIWTHGCLVVAEKTTKKEPSGGVDRCLTPPFTSVLRRHRYPVHFRR